jgi:hypothetical protein
MVQEVDRNVENKYPVNLLGKTPRIGTVGKLLEHQKSVSLSANTHEGPNGAPHAYWRNGADRDAGTASASGNLRRHWREHHQ